MMKRILLALSICVALYNQAQHYPLFSQYMNNGLVINPAYAGRNELTDIAVSHRRQWTGIPGSPVTTALTVNSPVKDYRNNVGFVFMDDRVGAVSKQYLSGIYAYRFKTKSYLCSFGVQGGLEFSRATWDRLARNDQNDELILSASTRTIGFTGGAGFYMHNEKSFFGLSVPYILNSNSNQLAGYGPVLFTGGWKFELKDSSAIKPSLLIRYTNGSPVQYDLNVSYHWKQKYGLGISYRSKESLVAILEIPVNKQFRVYYSYDFGMGDMKRYHNGSHEIMLRYFLVKDTEKQAEVIQPDTPAN